MNSDQFLQQSSIQLLPPRADDWKQSRLRARDVNTPVEIVFQLSQIPSDVWVRLFWRLYRLRYETAGSPRLEYGTCLIITCLPGQILALLECVQSLITDVNKILAPIIRAEADRVTSCRKCDEAIRSRSFNDASEKVTLLRDIALAEMDAAMTQMLEEGKSN